MTNPKHNCGDCSDAEVQALFCELLDPGTTAVRAAEIRQFIATCVECNERLQREETVREMVSKCCGSAQAPATLRSRISVSITEITYRA